MKQHFLYGLIVLLLALPPSVHATTVRVRVVDATGAAFPNVLVIVKSLEGKGEAFRVLTDQVGNIPEQDLPPGLYRAIATCPYGICETAVMEFLVRDNPAKLELKVDIPPTRGNVVVIGAPHIGVQLLDADGRPMGSAELLVRDSDAENERWYVTDPNGQVEVELPDGSVTFVVRRDDSVSRQTVRSAVLNELISRGKKLVIRFK